MASQPRMCLISNSPCIEFLLLTFQVEVYILSSVFACCCRGRISKLQGTVPVRAPVASAVPRPGVAGSEMSSAPAGHLVPVSRVAGAQRIGGACRSLSCRTVVPNAPLSDDFSRKAGICEFSAVLGKLKGLFFFSPLIANRNQEDDARIAECGPC